MSRIELKNTLTENYPPYLDALNQCGNPDCSSITPQAYQDTFIRRRPKDQVIYYGFAPVNFWKTLLVQLPLIFKGIIPSIPSRIMRDSMSQNMRIIFDKWTQASNGTLTFTEIPDSKLVDRGIYIYPISPEKIKKYVGTDFFAFTTNILDNNGYIKDSFIFLPDNSTYWGIGQNLTITIPQMLSAMSHEVGHTLGLNLDHSESTSLIEQQLKDTPMGKFCSVMPYMKYIDTEISSCPAFAPPQYGVYPGPLDATMLQTLYSTELTPLCFSQECIASYGYNIASAGWDALLMIFLSQNFYYFIRGLTKDEKPLIPEKAASLIASAGLSIFLITGYYTPVWTAAILTVLSSNEVLKQYHDKLLPILAKIMQKGGDERLLILNLLLAINRGYNPLALPLSMLAAGVATAFTGFMLRKGYIQFNFFGNKLAQIVMFPLKTLASCCPTQTSITHSPETYESQESKSSESLIINISEIPYQSLETPSRRTPCEWFSLTKLMRFFTSTPAPADINQPIIDIKPN